MCGSTCRSRAVPACRRLSAPWTSVPLGVVTLAERSGVDLAANPREAYRAMVSEMTAAFANFAAPGATQAAVASGRAHMVGNSGTVTTIASVLLGLQRYDRAQVDGAWVNLPRAMQVAQE